MWKVSRLAAVGRLGLGHGLQLMQSRGGRRLGAIHDLFFYRTEYVLIGFAVGGLSESAATTKQTVCVCVCVGG